MTWLEVMLVLLIVAVLCHFSLPLWREQWLLSQDKTLQLQLKTAILFAQHQALLNRGPVGICPTEDGLHCAKLWGKEWLIFLANDEVTRLDVIKHVRSSAMHGSLVWRAYPRYRLYLLMPSHPLLQNDNGTMWHCHDHNIQWALMFNQAGVLRFIYPDENGKIPGIPGKPLSC